MKFPRTVYVITHDQTKKKYVGSTHNLKKRIANHLNLLRAGKHPVEDMQKDFNDFGEDFTVEILDEINSIAESTREYEWMDRLNSNIRGVGYNYKDKMAPQNKKTPGNKKELHKLIDRLNDDQILFVLTFLKRIFG